MSVATPANLPFTLADIMGGTNRTKASVASGVPLVMTHTAKDLVIHTKLSLAAPLTIVAGAVGARAGGTKLLDFTACKAAILSSRIKLSGLSLSAGTATGTAGEVGLGTTQASGAVAVLSGTAGFKDILTGGVPALGNIAAGASLSNFMTSDGPRQSPVGDFANPWAVYLNAATTLGVAGSNFVVAAGSEFEFWWICHPNAS